MGQMRMSLVTIDGVATECAGLTVWWQLCKKVDCVRFEKAWYAAGLPTSVLQAPPSAVAVLERTMGQLFSDRQTIVKPVQGKEGSYAVLPKDTDSSNNPLYQTAWTASIKRVAGAGGKFEDVLEISSSCPSKAADQLETMFDCNLDTYGSREQSMLMTGVVRWLSGARLQQAGKLYFLPPDKVEDWRKVETALHAASGIQTFEIPALPAKSAMRAVLHAITNEATDVAMELEEEIKGFKAKGSRAATLLRRRDVAVEMQQKLSYYESFLGESLTELKDRLEKIALGCVKTDLITNDAI